MLMLFATAVGALLVAGFGLVSMNLFMAVSALVWVLGQSFVQGLARRLRSRTLPGRALPQS